MKYTLLYIMLFVFCHVSAAKTVEEENLFKSFSTFEDKIKAAKKNGAYQEVRIYLDSCFTLANEAESNFYMGRVYVLQAKSKIPGQEDSTLYYWDNALALLSDNKDSILFVETQFAKANTHIFQDEFFNGIVGLRQTFEILDERLYEYVQQDEDKVHMLRANCMVSLGMVYERFGDQKLALDYFIRAQRVLQRVNSYEADRFESTILSNIGMIYANLEKYKEAEYYTVKSIDLREKIGAKKSGFNYRLLAIIYYGRKKYTAALKYLDMAKREHKGGRDQDLLKDRFWEGKIRLANGQLEGAKNIFVSLTSPFERNFIQNDCAELYELLGETCKKTGETEEAFYYLNQALETRRKIENTNDRRAFDEFLSFFDEQESEFDNRIALIKSEQEKAHLALQVAADKEWKKWLSLFFTVVVILLLAIISVITIAYRRNKKSTQVLQKNIQQKSVLFQEVHHRVKNNFQIISSLLNLQKGAQPDSNRKMVLTEAQSRIQAMSLVHEMLYRTDDLRQIEFNQYCKELGETIIDSYGAEKKIALIVNSNDAFFELDVAIPLGLILNEALTNAIKYAFQDREKGIVKIELDQKGRGYELTISDNGIGFASSCKGKGNKPGLGLDLIAILTEQLDGKVTVESERGTQIRISIG